MGEEGYSPHLPHGYATDFRWSLVKPATASPHRKIYNLSTGYGW